MEKIENTFSERIKKLRVQKNLSRIELADKLGVIKQTVGHWENGRNLPKIDLMCKVADFFEVSLDYLVGRSDDPVMK